MGDEHMIDTLRKHMAAKDRRIEDLEDQINKIRNWAEAYPVDVFPEPDFKRVEKALHAEGINLCAVSASNMRHVIKGVLGIIEEAGT